jgi:hypothetical protein
VPVTVDTERGEVSAYVYALAAPPGR